MVLSACLFLKSVKVRGLICNVTYFFQFSWLRHCVTSRKVAGFFPMMSLEFFIDNPSGRTMALGSTQPLTEMSTRNISWG